jgi:hypothetical protein
MGANSQPWHMIQGPAQRSQIAGVVELSHHRKRSMSLLSSNMSDSTVTPATTAGITSSEAVDTESPFSPKDTFDDPLHSSQPSQQPAAGGSPSATRNEANRRNSDTQANPLTMANTPPSSTEAPSSRPTASSSSNPPSILTENPVTQDPKVLCLHAMFPDFDIAVLCVLI